MHIGIDLIPAQGDELYYQESSNTGLPWLAQWLGIHLPMQGTRV